MVGALSYPNVLKAAWLSELGTFMAVISVFRSWLPIIPAAVAAWPRIPEALQKRAGRLLCRPARLLAATVSARV